MWSCFLVIWYSWFQVHDDESWKLHHSSKEAGGGGCCHGVLFVCCSWWILFVNLYYWKLQCLIYIDKKCWVSEELFNCMRQFTTLLRIVFEYMNNVSGSVVLSLWWLSASEGKPSLKALFITGLRHLFPHHQLPHGADVQTQVGRFCNSLHGGDRQGDLGDEAGCQCSGQRVCHGVSQKGKDKKLIVSSF